MAQYVRIVNNIIAEHIASPRPPKGKGWIEVDTPWAGAVGMQADWFNWENGGKVKPVDQLIKEGLILDKRGTYYDTRTGQQHIIDRAGVEPKETWTTKPPIAGEPIKIQTWDGEKWVIDKAKKREFDEGQLVARKAALIAAITEKQALGEDITALQVELKDIISQLEGGKSV